MARQSTANEIINRAAVEVGLLSVSDPVSSIDESFIQLTELLNGVGQELVELFPWQFLVRVYSVEMGVTPPVSGTTNAFALPENFSYMIDQTGWDRANNLPMGGPLSAQDWTYLQGRDLVSQTIYASFRLFDNVFNIFPDPPPAGLKITFEYISRDWVREQGQASANRDTIGTGSDIVLYEPILAVKFLKAKFLESKGFDASSARLEFENMMGSRTGKDTGAPILNAANASRGFPYLSPYYNTGDTGFGG